MYATSAIFVLMSVVVYTNAAVALFPAQEKPAEFVDQEGCYLKHLKKVIPYGDYYVKGSCYKYTCYPSNVTQVLTCGVAVIDERSPCQLISDESRDFPDCCPMVMCHTIPPEASTSEGSSEKTTDTPVVEHLSTSERANEGTTVSPVSKLITSGSHIEGTSDVPLLKYLSTSERVNEEITNTPVSKHPSTSESASEETTIGPLVERLSTSDASATHVPGTSEPTAVYRSINDDTVNELLVAQASIHSQ